jgi:hypothetical protein
VGIDPLPYEGPGSTFSFEPEKAVDETLKKLKEDS